MATRINPKRLRLVVSMLFAIGLLGVGIYILYGEYPAFARAYERDFQVQYIEKQSGQKYAVWQAETSKKCMVEMMKDDSPAKGGTLFEDQNQLASRMCSGPFAMAPVPTGEIGSAFFGKVFLVSVAYAATAIVLSWLLGLLIVRAIPATMRRSWGWLTTDENA